MSKFVKGMLLIALMPCFGMAADSALQSDDVKPYFLPEELNSPGVLNSFQELVSAPAVPLKDTQKRLVNIALIYPSSDLSDFWTRNFQALTARLNDLNIDFQVDEYSSRQLEHSLQTRYTEEVLAKADHYDYVIFGPSELLVQTDNIQKLSASSEFQTYIWAFHTPYKDWQYQPDAWFDFSSSAGAKVLCKFMIERLGHDVYFAMNRGIPGITDDQRSGEFKECVEAQGDWLNLYEHFGQYQAGGGVDGASLVTESFPEVTMLHNANTAMTLGVLRYLKKHQLLNQLYVTGWGGTAAEIDQIKQGYLNATPMRMGDDVGVATAEAIKLTLENKIDQVPKIYLGRIQIVDDQMSNEEINKLTDEAFRYSGHIDQ
ncbi:substrate-binding domain-containing protein [Marinomonas ostreistagni]|uniref:Ribose ABC transporter substrate-binding protein n=1 Tax=Marinomonas ostreistagni TaxID=359209 RepID=A0ABS0Z8W4_9GAMM|nr:substrate-binding domain-containing protein [Marinomonas ostreistagni]MBJ7550094.1 ribose ABC transporter substrate-binding protein [Marinomonas ostreistagni]